MLIIDTFSHITLRGRITWLLLFFLCWYCCPSVLYVSFFFGVVAFFSENSVIKDFSWTMTIFFFLSWFSIAVSLLPIIVYVTVESYHDYQRGLIQKANNVYCSANPYYGIGIPAVPIITQAPGTFNDACTTAYNSFYSVTSGFAMLIDRSVSIRDAPFFRHYHQVSDDYQQRWISYYGLGEPFSSIDFFRGLAAYIDYVDALKYWNTSFGMDSLLSRMTTLNITASSLEHASLVHAPPTDDSLLDSTGDISSFVACRCGGSEYTSRGSCSCLGHACSGADCACLTRGNGSRYGILRINGNLQAESQHLSGLARGACSSGGWFLVAMNDLQDQLARLTLGGGNSRFTIYDVPNDHVEDIDRDRLSNSGCQSWNISGANSLLPSDAYVSEVLSSMMSRCLSIMDDQINNDGDNDNGNSAVEISSKYESRLNNLDTQSISDLMIYKNSEKTITQESITEGHDCIDHNTPTISGSSSSICLGNDHHNEESNGSDVEISRHSKDHLNNVDTDTTCNSSSNDSDLPVSLNHNYKGDDIDEFADSSHNHSDGSQCSVHDCSTSTGDEEIQRDIYSSSDHGDDVWSNTSNYSGASPASPTHTLTAYDYEESYNPFNSDDNNSSTGTAPLYTGTAVFNDESAFGTFDF